MRLARVGIAVALATCLALPGCLRAQGATPAATEPITFRITGMVTDTLGHPVGDAIVTATLVRTGGNADSIAVRSSATGEYTINFALVRPWPGGQVAVLVRRLGFTTAPYQAALPATLPEEGVLARVSFRLVPAPTALATVNVSGKHGSALAAKYMSAADINPRYVSDALRALARYRPLMLGDTDRCPAPPLAQGETAYAVSRLYVNGQRRDIPGRQPFTTTFFPLPKSASISPSVIAALEDIPSEDIAEIHLVDCNDRDFPIDRRKALYVALKPKPLTKGQRKALEALRRDTTTTGAPHAADSTKAKSDSGQVSQS